MITAKCLVLSPWLVLVSVLLGNSQAKAQFNVYHPFPDSNAVWGMGAGCIDGNCGTGEYIRDSYSGDTLIDGFTYKRIEHEVLVTAGGCCYPPEGLGMGFLREDVSARKVYWRWPGESSDTLLYDFNLDVGDTINGLFRFPSNDWIVVSVDSVIVDSNYRRRINFDTSDVYQCMRFSFIEGVGSTAGLTNEYYGPGEMGSILECFSVGGEVRYTEPCNPDTVACGELPVNVQSFFNKRTELAVSPNPSSGQFTINGIIKPTTVFVYSSTGQPVWQGSGNTIDLTAQPPGVYTAVIATERGRQAVRLVVLR